MSKKKKIPELSITETANAILCDCNLFPYLLEGVTQEYLRNDPDLPPQLAEQFAVAWVPTQMAVMLSGLPLHEQWTVYDEFWVSLLKRIVGSISTHYGLPIGDNYVYQVEPIKGPSLCIVYHYKGVLQ